MGGVTRSIPSRLLSGGGYVVMCFCGLSGKNDGHSCHKQACGWLGSKYLSSRALVVLLRLGKASTSLGLREEGEGWQCLLPPLLRSGRECCSVLL